MKIVAGVHITLNLSGSLYDAHKKCNFRVWLLHVWLDLVGENGVGSFKVMHLWKEKVMASHILNTCNINWLSILLSYIRWSLIWKKNIKLNRLQCLTIPCTKNLVSSANILEYLIFLRNVLGYRGFPKKICKMLPASVECFLWCWNFSKNQHGKAQCYYCLLLLY